MAYVSASLTSVSAVDGANFSPDMPAHESGDVLLVIGNQTTTVAIGASADWSTPIQQPTTQGGQRIFATWKRAASSSETLSLTGGTGSWNTVILVIKDAAPGTFIDGFAVAAIAAGVSANSPALTTTTGGCLLVYAFGMGSSARPYLEASQLVPRGRGTNGSPTLVVGSSPQLTAGPVPTATATDVANGGALVVAIRNVTGGTQDISPAGGHINVQRYTAVQTWLPLSSLFSGTLAGLDFSSSAPANVARLALTLPQWGACNNVISGENTSGLWVGGVNALPAATDFRDAAFSIYVGHNGSYFPSLQGENGVLLALADAAGSWKAWQLLEGRLGGSAGQVFFRSADSTPYASSGTLDLSAITQCAILRHRRGSSTVTQGLRVGFLRIHRPPILRGGGPNLALDTFGLANSSGGFELFETWAQQGTGQTLARHHIQIGDGGTTPTNFINNAKSLELPVKAGTAPRLWDVSEGHANISILAGAGDAISFASSIVATDQRHDFIIDPISSLSATYDFAGFACVGYRVFWKTGVACAGAGFTRCHEIDAKAAVFTNCVFRSGANSGGAAMKIDPGAAIRDCQFIKGLEANAIRIPVAGSYDLRGCTFSGYTTVLDVTATTGTVSIQLASGQAQPTFTTAGATIEFIQPQPPVTVTCVDAATGLPVSGVRVLLRTVGGVTVLSGMTDAAGQISAVWSGAAPINVTGWARKASASPFYIEGKIAGVITPSGFATTILLQAEG